MSVLGQGDKKSVGRPLVGDKAMTAAERKANQYARLKAEGIKQYSVRGKQKKIEKYAKQLDCSPASAAQAIFDAGVKSILGLK